jgi:hypothetical protein
VAEAQAAIATVQGHRSAVFIDISASGIIELELAEVQSAIAVDEGQRSAGNIDTSAIIAHTAGQGTDGHRAGPCVQLFGHGHCL